MGHTGKLKEHRTPTTTPQCEGRAVLVHMGLSLCTEVPWGRGAPGSEGC